MQTDEFNNEVWSLIFRFYARVLAFPYDELTHELQHLFRQIEIYVETDIDTTGANTVLDILNYYQGEEMQDLQAEYARLFSPVNARKPFISLRLSEIAPHTDQYGLMDHLYESSLFIEMEDYPDSITNVLEYFSSLLLENDAEATEDFYNKYIKTVLPILGQQIYQGTNLSFYKAFARGLSEIVQLLS